MRVLLIDDQIKTNDNLIVYLEDEFHTVDELSRVKSREHLEEKLNRFQPEGVILDFEMQPRGDEIYRWVKKWREDVMIVFYTKYAKTKTDREKMIEVGASEEEIVQKEEVRRDYKKLLQILRAVKPVD